MNLLTRFGGASWEAHFKAVKCLFGYLKKHSVKWTKIDALPHVPMGPVMNLEKSNILWEKLYPGSKDGLEPDPKHPKPYDKKMHSIVYFDTSFASNKVTRRSTTGVVVFAGKTLVLWVSKRQGAIATSTYSAELLAEKNRTEKAVLI